MYMARAPGTGPLQESRMLVALASRLRVKFRSVFVRFHLSPRLFFYCRLLCRVANIQQQRPALKRVIHSCSLTHCGDADRLSAGASILATVAGGRGGRADVAGVSVWCGHTQMHLS